MTNPRAPSRLPELRNFALALALSLCLANGPFSLVATSADNSRLNQYDVIPILLQHCSVCHGAQLREGGLDARTRASLLQGGKSGPAFVPGKPDQSLMVQRIRANECPPSKRLVEASVKPVESSALGKLTDWIAAGAPESPADPDLAGTPQDPLVREKDREFWAFRPPKPLPPPAVRHPELVRNPMDAFVLSKLEEKNLSFAQEAPKSVLLRRACFDLTGLPPSPTEAEAFLADADPHAYEKLIDRLLASPRYGERWGRYWLDVAGYADVEGRREQHLPRTFAYRYRDYVIQAFNADKPYDRFLLEQIAGDELADYEHAAIITQEIYDNLVATGFLRMGPDPTWANITGFGPDRLDVIADAMDVFGSGVMGLTLKCARCHDHKFDPIPQRDYYRVVDLFKGAMDEYNWLKPDRRAFGGARNTGPLGERSIPFVLPEERQAWAEHNKRIQSEIDQRAAALREKEARLREKYRDAELARLPEEIRENARKMLAVSAAERTPAQRQLAEEHEKKLSPDANTLKKFDADFKRRSDELAALENQKRPEPRIAALWDRGDPSPTYMYRRGDYLRPGALVTAGVPAVLTDGHTPFEVRPPWSESQNRFGNPSSASTGYQPVPSGNLPVGTAATLMNNPGTVLTVTPSAIPVGRLPTGAGRLPAPPIRQTGTQKTGRRLALARWLIRPDHPLTSRVMVNRIWQHHFGQGLVKSVGNFGHTGTPPTHPELLDWLAGEFVRQGWRMKSLHRLIMTSRTYRQSSVAAADALAMDPENALLSRMPLRRLDADALWDTCVSVAGSLDETRFGPSVPVQTKKDGVVTPGKTGEGWRRSLYGQQLRKDLPTLHEIFDAPQMNPNCLERSESTVATQALHLLNDSVVRELAGRFAERVRRDAGSDPAGQVERAFWIAFGRSPTLGEKETGVELLQRLSAAVSERPVEGAEVFVKGESRVAASEMHSLAVFCHTLMNSAEFVYID